jgi:hypothetical protein
LIDSDRPGAPYGGEAGNGGEGQRHADQHGQTVAEEFLFRARKHKRQHRQNARAQDGQHATQEHQ